MSDRQTNYQVPCSRADHDEGDWSRMAMPWSGTLLHPREPVKVRLYHGAPYLAVLSTDTVIEAVGSSWDPGDSGGSVTFLFIVRTGPYNGRCGHIFDDSPVPGIFEVGNLVRGSQDKGVPIIFELVC